MILSMSQPSTLLPGVLDAQLRRDADLTHFEYYVLAMLSEASGHTLRMTALAERTNATLPRLSHVRRLVDRKFVDRFPSLETVGPPTFRLSAAGWAKVRESVPGHVANVRHHVIDVLTPLQLDQLAQMMQALLERLDPDGAMHDF